MFLWSQTYEPLPFCDSPHLVPPPHGCRTSTSRQPALIATDPGEEAACPSLSSEAWTCACVAWGQGCLPWQVSPALIVGPELPGVWSGTS